MRAAKATAVLTAGVLSLALAGAPAAAAGHDPAQRPETASVSVAPEAQWHYVNTYFSFDKCVTARDDFREVGIWAECFLRNDGARYELWTWW
ncbi:hypothetical protein QLQ12_44935 [Actinoplanes sp. NEAU-A12]|uniref:Secreted protein n=1 Tax=Actinoplanes sandaracinus TaxID=3045177 RepID=A0ABT6X157_9ACTN|nr:hypothetical protein [Actinoplanes sandaracinus]MDI6105747.1 hypothetical protein [Actinoplanes sandaracinus]